MAYLDVITLAEAKNYLRIDDTLTEDDVRITSMIQTALSTIETRTNILVYARSKTYRFQDYCVRVYDYPINSVISPTDVDEDNQTLYVNYGAYSVDDTTLTLNVGYEDAEDVPSWIRDTALEYVKYMYYDAETNSANKGLMPAYIENIINQNRRFTL